MIRLDRHARDWLNSEASNTPVVHSIFDHVINVKTTRGTLVTIQKQGLPMQPATIQPGERDFVAIMDACKNPSKQIDLQFLKEREADTVSLAIPALMPLENAADPITFLRAWLKAHGNRGGLYAVLFPERVPAPTLMERKLAAVWAVSEEAYRFGGLTGLGVGLTPSGDDALHGLVAVMHAFLGKEAACRVSGDSRHRLMMTTDVSRTMLTHAFSGETNESLLALLKVLSAGSWLETEEAFRDVNRIGSTSGTDTLIGVLKGLQLVQAEQIRRNRHHGKTGDHQKECVL
ncbi:DUF2877 domain-containing protein [Salisediminibacterium selenitireducens]|uniref:DUF2877 domain-containing protein n=1 Tax=Bacillus selenitireducens (strain ATCC 700615 / DSM 15326 / MLS10) TaxID=439292 RepID=D6XVT6_BACIE|nr:DUF2877 domain-containing protein [Salisediminibacterium selenitireducens]ADH97709.1 hypothetical protein Bsel_0160 [[Bacillus] selenitireducens MLS10]